MKGYDSVPWLSCLAEQEVTKKLFDRQIDLFIMKDFAPVAQRYSQACQGQWSWKDDLLQTEIGLDSALNPEVTIDDA